MSAPRRLWGVGCAVIALSGIGFLIIALTHAQVAATSLAAAQDRRDALRIRVKSVDSQRDRPTTSPTPESKAVATESVDAFASATESTAPSNFGQYYALVAANPKLQALHLRKFELLEEGSSRLARLRLREDQLQRIRTAAVERETARLDLASAAQAQGLSFNDPRIKQMDAQLWRDYYGKFNEVLGADELARYRAEAKAIPGQQPLADWLNAKATMAGAALTPEQGSELARILSEFTPPGSGQPQGGYWHRAHRVDWAAALPKIAAAGFPVELLATIRPVIEENRLSGIQSEMINAVTRQFPAMDAAARKLLADDIGYYNAPGLPPHKR